MKLFGVLREDKGVEAGGGELEVEGLASELVTEPMSSIFGFIILIYISHLATTLILPVSYDNYT